MIKTTESLTVRDRLGLFFGISPQLIVTIFLVRLFVDTGVRMVYPFIPQISEGLKLTLTGFSWLLFIRSLAGFVGPLFGVLADRYGRRKIMAVGLLAQCIGVMGIVLLPGWWTAVPMVLFGVGSTIFIPVQQAYISDQVSYEKRGRALASVDISYATVGIFVLPVVGWLIETFGWRNPFFVLSFLSLIAAAIVWHKFPGTEERSQAGQTLPAMWRACLKPNVAASIGVALLLFVSLGCFVTVWSVWLSSDFGLDAVALGLVATTIGVAELGGASASGLLIDRIGKKRGSQLGMLLTVPLLLLLPVVRGNLFWIKVTLVSIGALFEFSIVSLLPLFSEQVPEARATILSLVGLGVSVGFGLGPPITALLWEKQGLQSVCLVAALSLLAALILLRRFLQEGTPQSVQVVQEL